MSKFNTFTNHPLIPNSQEYMVIRKYVSIHSEDRDVLKYPNSAEFEMELPQDYVNVLSIRLESWAFPSKYNTFSKFNKNITMSFQIISPSHPNTPDEFDLQYNIYLALYENIQNMYSITIESGHYTPQQMANELTNKFNEVVTNYIYNYILVHNGATLSDAFITAGGYTDFVIVYNEVSQKLWFGNRSGIFVLSNIDNNSSYVLNSDDKIIPNPSFTSAPCPPSKTPLPDYTNWGLPSYLGLPRNPLTSTSVSGVTQVPRLYYLPASASSWLTPNPDISGCSVSFIEAENTINVNGPAYFYMDLSHLNNIDETNPYNLSSYALHTNETNSRVNASFAKILISDSCCVVENNKAYKIYNPPAERIRKIKLRMRFHNGQLVDFGSCEYSFVLEFTLYNAQQSKKYNNYIPENNIFT